MNPAEVETERTVLGAVLVHPTALASAAVYLKPNHFYLPAHRDVFAAMLGLADSGDPVDIVTLVDALRRRDRLQAAGGAAYIAGLVDGLPRVDNVDHWAKMIRDRALVRQVRVAADRIKVATSTEAVNGPEAVEIAMREVLAAADAGMDDMAIRSPVDDLTGGYRYLETLATTKGGITGIKTGLDDLDTVVGGWHQDELIIIGARPGIGKTALAILLGETAAASGRTVAFFSLEMPWEQIAQRRLCIESRVSSRRLHGRPDAPELGEIMKAFGRLGERKFYTFANASLTMSQIRAQVQRLKATKGGVDLVVIDYLQLMRGDGTAESRQQEVSAISRALKVMAMDLHVPVIALSQLNRGSLQHAGKQPSMEDLRESGSLEQDADVVILLHRPEVYEPEDKSLENMAEVIVAKQRNGPTEVVKARFDKTCMRFDNLDKMGDWDGSIN